MSHTSSEKPLVALIGNPNCGKTTLFNQITGLNKKTGNWSGVTVNSQFCAVNYDQLDYNLVDLPGIYALSIDSSGQDESHVKEFFDLKKPDLIVNIINSTSLQRGLFLTLELMEYGCPIITVLNMADEAEKKNIVIDTAKLSELLGHDVTTIVATKGTRVKDLQNTINHLIIDNKKDRIYYKVKYSDEVTQKISPLLTNGISIAHALSQINDKHSDQVFKAKLDCAQIISNQVHSKTINIKNKETNLLDKITIHPVYGIMAFFCAMYIMFFFAINVSSVFVDFFDIAANALFINGGHKLLAFLGVPQSISVILADGIGGGIQTVATFIPVIGFLYLILTWFEDSGYMSRAAFVMNGLMQKIGLSGQAFVPLIVSFGCNVPAIMATRTLPTKRERLVTIMMAPFMSCGARLSVYALFVAAFFSQYASLIVFSLYIIGIVMAILTGLLLQKTILPGKAEPFLIELPPWRFPTIKNLLSGTWNRLKGFLIDAGKIIIIMVMIIQVLNSIGKDFSWGNQDSENSVLSVTAKLAVPVFEPMGIDEDNWPAIVGILTGVLAKEVVVGTLDAIYTSLDKKENDINEPDPSIKEELLMALASIKENAIGLSDLLLDPLGLSIASVGSDEQMAENQDVSDSLFGIIRDRFSDKYAAFAYLLFILLYFPCVAATAAIAREAGIKWAIFSGAWSTGLAYMTAVCFFQISHFSQNPTSAIIWTSIFIAIITMLYLYLKKVGKLAESLKLNIID